MRQRECVTERNSGYFINTKSRPCVSHCPGVELSDCNTIVLCYCKQDVLYCYCCSFREEFPICDLQPSDREAKTYLLKTNLHHLIRTLKNTIAIPVSGFFSLRLGKSRVLLVKDTIKKIYRGKSRFSRLFKGKQKDQSLGFSLRYIHSC